MKWVFVCGAHSVGKTTLCNHLMETMKIERSAPKLISEVARSILAAKKITYVSTNDVQQFQDLNFQILKEQHKRMAEMRISAKDDTFCISDRGPLDPICYLQMFVGSKEAISATQLDHVTPMIKLLTESDDSLVVVIKPHEQFLECDNVRINTSFNELLQYNEIMRKLLEELNIRYVYLEEPNLNARARGVVEGIKNVWPSLEVTIDQ